MNRSIGRLLLYYVVLGSIGTALTILVGRHWPSLKDPVLIASAIAAAFALSLRRSKSPDPACSNCGGKGFTTHECNYEECDGQERCECMDGDQYWLP